MLGCGRALARFFSDMACCFSSREGHNARLGLFADLFSHLFPVVHFPMSCFRLKFWNKGQNQRNIKEPNTHQQKLINHHVFIIPHLIISSYHIMSTNLPISVTPLRPSHCRSGTCRFAAPNELPGASPPAAALRHWATAAKRRWRCSMALKASKTRGWCCLLPCFSHVFSNQKWHLFVRKAKPNVTFFAWVLQTILNHIKWIIILINHPTKWLVLHCFFGMFCSILGSPWEYMPMSSNNETTIPIESQTHSAAKSAKSTYCLAWNILKPSRSYWAVTIPWASWALLHATLTPPSPAPAAGAPGAKSPRAGKPQSRST